MSIKKYRDWRDWFDGLRSKAMQAGAESLVTNIGAMIGSNGVASMIPSMNGFVLTWKAAVVTTASQFFIRTVFAAAKYIAAKPDPDVIEENIETTFTSKDPTTGTVVIQTSKQTTSTPVAPIVDNAP